MTTARNRTIKGVSVAFEHDTTMGSRMVRKPGWRLEKWKEKLMQSEP